MINFRSCVCYYFFTNEENNTLTCIISQHQPQPGPEERAEPTAFPAPPLEESAQSLLTATAPPTTKAQGPEMLGEGWGCQAGKGAGGLSEAMT